MSKPKQPNPAGDPEPESSKLPAPIGGLGGSSGGALVPALEVGAEWLRVDGDQGDVVMSSRVRLARNLAMRPFATKASKRDRQATLEQCRDAVLRTAPPASGAGAGGGGGTPALRRSARRS